MFRKEYLAILLASFGLTTQAFSPVSVGRSTFVNTQNSVKSASLVDARRFTLSVVSSTADEVSEPSTAEEPVTEEEEKPRQRTEEDDINCVAYVVNLSYGK